MWFVFGLVTLTCFCIYYVYKKLNASWEGISKETNGVSYQYKLITKKDEIEEVLVGIECPSGFDFSLKREGAVDRFFKKVGIAREHEIGNKKFDDLVYVLSDHSVLHKQISENPKLVDAILLLFSSRFGYGVNVQEVRCHSGRIWFRYQAPMGFEEDKVTKLATALVPTLQSISTELQTAGLPKDKKWKDPFVIKAAVILAISSGIVLNGTVQSFRLLYLDLPFILDTKPLMIDAALVGVGMVVLLAILTLFILGRSSRTHLVLVELMFMGTLGCALTAYAQIRDVNIELDEAAGVEHIVYTHRKKEVKSRRSRSYYLYVDDWTDENKVRRIEVSSSFFSSVYKGNKLLLTEKPGYLGYRWVSDLEKL